MDGISNIEVSDKTPRELLGITYPEVVSNEHLLYLLYLVENKASMRIYPVPVRTSSTHIRSLPADSVCMMLSSKPAIHENVLKQE
jgi:hypothetical protein